MYAYPKNFPLTLAKYFCFHIMLSIWTSDLSNQ